eukprot:GFUD01043176.1.p1 GENE.GFUD01043176.1~~GFUD01043176.1.p1  ORF type:complete len:588 (+),score=142.40 GFUD01043176.1:62-1825(+)
MLMKNKTIDEDYTPIVRKRQRCKKPRDKMSTMYSIPIKVLGLREEVTTSGGKIKRGKRFGFSVYNALTCKQCRPNRVFHKRIGLSVHNKEMHGKDICSVFKVPNISISQRSRSLPVRNTRTVVPVKKSSSLRAPLIRTKTNTRDNDEIEVIEIDLIDWDDEDSDEIQEIEVLIQGEDDSNGNNNEFSLQLSPRLRNRNPTTANKPEDDSANECVEVVEVGENSIRSYKPKECRWMENSPHYQPKVFLTSTSNSNIKLSSRLRNRNPEAANEPEDDSEIECLEVIEVSENHIRSYKPKEYRWMESSPLYQPKVFLTSNLNIKLREAECEKVEEINHLDDSGSSQFNDILAELNDSVSNDILAELNDSDTSVTIDDEVIVLGDADPVQLEEATFLESLPHVRNLFDETEFIINSKRKSFVMNSSSKRVKAALEDEMLLFEEPDDEDVPDINSMLEVSMNESEENSTNDSIEIVELEETNESEGNSTNNSIDIVELEETTSVTESDIVVVNLNELVEEDVEIVALEEVDEDHKNSATASVQDAVTKPKSIKDLVSMWSSEEEASTALKKIPTRTKKRRSELKPYLNSRGL